METRPRFRRGITQAFNQSMATARDEVELLCMAFHGRPLTTARHKVAKDGMRIQSTFCHGKSWRRRIGGLRSFSYIVTGWRKGGQYQSDKRPNSFKASLSKISVR
ncbi:hypothetical protein PoB_007053500 [Plakobranchus ocellatus]|uniref:Uncharacterized protein n=1 Tax=Plakobranchus ocellatus TaxID=259542 RepID=A0AAV4DJ74_9GAST|nr:hypothetical protein PoB_007053500 [Plakobranchus ocellatus]